MLKKVKILVIISVFVGVLYGQLGYHYLFAIFQTGWNDTAWVDTFDLCNTCSLGYDFEDCRDSIIAMLEPDLDSLDSLWHGFLLRFVVYDSSLGEWDTYFVNDTLFCAHGRDSGIINCYVFPAQGCWAYTCDSTVYGYNVWYVPISVIPHFTFLNSGDSVCFLITKGDSLGYQCHRYDNDTALIIMRIILDDTISLKASQRSERSHKVYRYPTGVYDITGRRVVAPKRSGVYIQGGKKKVLVK